MKRKNSLLPMYQQPMAAASRFRLSKRSTVITALALFLTASLIINYFVVFTKSLPISYAIANPIPNPPHPTLTSLIMVPGHAIYHGVMNDLDLNKDEGWTLEEFQKGGQIKVFMNHIKKGIELLQEDEKSLLVMSGGETRPLAGPLSEAQSYWQIAQYYLSKTTSSSSLSRIATEEHARDSMENLLFSICRFYELTGNYPKKITVIGFEFKKERFIKIHRAALRYPIEKFDYIGIDPEDIPKEVAKGENQNSLGPFEQDVYGCHGRLWQKKLDRNPFRRQHAYRQTCPALAPLMGYCPTSRTEIFPGTLPW
ncbi:unnamed protein product [Umbelopsis ramanniana]